MKVTKMRKWTLLLCMCMLLGLCTACGPTKEQTFVENDFSVTLTNRFEKENISGVKYAYSDGKAALTVTNLSKKEIEETGLQITSLNRFAILALKSYEGADNAFVRDGLNHSYCEFDTVQNGTSLSCYAAFYESDTHYWLVLFGATPEQYDDYQSSFANWASTVTVE